MACSALPAHAQIQDKTVTLAGAQVEYEVLLPPNYSPAKSYPLILVFTGGAQGAAAARNTIEVDWQAEAEKRGYVVVSPAAPDGDLYFEGGDRVFPAFLEMIRKDYRIAGKIHIAGHSNGGLSAFHIAAKHPAWFSTVTGYPGMFHDLESDPVEALKPMCVFMHVGGLDRFWLPAMQDQDKELAREGFRIRFTVEKNQTHRLNAPQIGLSKRLFDEIESCR